MSTLFEGDKLEMELSPQQEQALIESDLIFPTSHGESVGRYRITTRTMEAAHFDANLAFAYIEGFLAGRGL